MDERVDKQLAVYVKSRQLKQAYPIGAYTRSATERTNVGLVVGGLAVAGVGAGGALGVGAGAGANDLSGGGDGVGAGAEGTAGGLAGGGAGAGSADS